MAALAVSVDIGSSAVRVAQVRADRPRPALLRFGQATLPPGAVIRGHIRDVGVVAGALQTLLMTSEIPATRVVVGVTGSAIAAHRHAGATRAIVASCPPAHVHSLLDTLEGAGLRAAAVEPAALAVLRAVGSSHAAEAVVEIGAGVTQVVVHQRGVPSEARTLFAGGDDLTAELAVELGIPLADAEAVKRNASLGHLYDREGALRVLDRRASDVVDAMSEVTGLHHKGGGAPISRIVISGGGGCPPVLTRHLERGFHVVVDTPQPLSRVRLSKSLGRGMADLVINDHRLAVVLGLALRRPSDPFLIDLMPPSRRRRRSRAKLVTLSA